MGEQGHDHQISVLNEINSPIASASASAGFASASAEQRRIYRKLYLAALNGEWETARSAIAENFMGYNDPITRRNETILHVAAASGHTNFVQQLVNQLTYEDLDFRDCNRNAAIHLAAMSGRVEVVRVIRERGLYLDVDSAMTRGNKDMLPLDLAISRGHRKMIKWLYDATINHVEAKGDLFVTLIRRNIYDIALEMIKADSSLATSRHNDGETALHALAQLPPMDALHFSQLRPEGTGELVLHALLQQPRMLQRALHFRQWWLEKIPKKCIDFLLKFDDIRKLSDFGSALMKERHQKAVYSELLRRICEEVVLLDDPEITELIETPWKLIFKAVELGNLELLTIFIRAYPEIIYRRDDNGYTIFHTAVLHRQENIFKLIDERGPIKNFIVDYKDKEHNNILHLAADWPKSRLDVVPGAALQLQREYQWFKEVKKVVPPDFLKQPNKKEKTPEALLADKLGQLSKDGEKWMKGTADKCMVVAALIATVVFAVAYTVPGGNVQDSGIPIYLKKIAFKVFVVSDALSLVFSACSIVTFLSILTSLHSPTDFVHLLPSKLAIGLGTLFASIVAMLMAFTAALFLIFDHGNGLIWYAIPIAVLAQWPVNLFYGFMDVLHDMWTIFLRPNKEPLFLEGVGKRLIKRRPS